MKTTIIIVLLLISVTASAQTRTFRWETELCRSTGIFDAKKVTGKKLRNTLKLSQTAGWYPLETNTTARNIADIAKLGVDALDREYAQKSGELRSLDIVDVPYWQTFRERKLRELEQAYRLRRTSMRAYQDQKILLEYKDAPACTVKYANPMISGGEELLGAWRMLNEESRKKNGDPERVRRIYEEHLGSPDKMRFALIEVMTFGWTNCANALIDYISGDETPEKEFKKLFKRTRTIRCDGP